MKKLIFTAVFALLMTFDINAVALSDFQNIEIPSRATENIYELTDYSFYEAAEQIAEGTYTADFNGVVGKTLDMFFSEVKKNMRVMTAVILLGVICTFITNLNSISSESAVAKASFLSCYSVLAALTAAGFTDASELVKNAVEDMGIFTKALIPALTSIAISGGKVISAPAVHTQVMAASALSTEIMKKAVLPLSYASFAVKFINNMTAFDGLTNLSRFLDKLCKRILSFILLIFTAMLTLTNFAAGTAESMGLKTARFALNTVVPVAGGALADTVSSLAASAQMIKNSVGLAGIVGIALIGAYPVIKCAAMSFLYSLAGALIQPVADKRLSSAVSAVGDCMGMLFAVAAVTAALYIISAAIMLSAVGS